jgi:hypothetical protein
MRGRALIRGAWTLPLLALTASPAAGQRVVELPDRDRRLGVDLEHVYAVGSLDGEDWELFGDVNQVAFDRSGNLYVLDRQNHRVVVVDRQGHLLRQLGKQGEGPGEWRMPGAMGVLPDGSVVVADAGHRAYMVYSPDGEYSHSVSMGAGTVISLGRLLPDPRGGAVYNAQGGGFTMRVAVGGAAPETPSGRPIERIDLAHGGAVATFYDAWLPPPAPEEGGGAGPRISLGGGEGVMRVGSGPRTFEPGLRVAILPDGGLAVVDSSAYVVKLVGPNGRDRARIVRGVRPTRVTERIQEAEKARQLAQLEAGEGPRMQIMVRGPGGGGAQPMDPAQIREMQRQQIESRGFYHEIPVLRNLAASPAGTLWLERAQTDPSADGPIDLVRTDGTYLGTIAVGGVRTPAAFGPDGLAAYIVLDEFDVPTIEVKRLPAEVR